MWRRPSSDVQGDDGPADNEDSDAQLALINGSADDDRTDAEDIFVLVRERCETLLVASYKHCFVYRGQNL